MAMKSSGAPMGGARGNNYGGGRNRVATAAAAAAAGGPNDRMEQQPEEEEWEFPFMCHNCSGWGHVRADCPSKKKQAGGMKTAVF